jgi:hypothetical protein
MRQSLMSKAATLAAGIAVSTTVSAVMLPDAQAATITRTVNGVSYDISTFQGTQAELESILPTQEWWGDIAKANLFATAVGGDLGLPNRVGAGLLPSGVFFASSSSFGSFSGSLFIADAGIASNIFQLPAFNLGRPNTFATATRTPTPTAAVPTPALLPGLIYLGISVWRKRNGKSISVEA